MGSSLFDPVLRVSPVMPHYLGSADFRKLWDVDGGFDKVNADLVLVPVPGP